MENSGNTRRRNFARTLRYTARKIYALPEDTSETLDALEDFLRQTWNIYGASALFGLKFEESHLKKYAKKLREEIATSLAGENVTYNAKFVIDETIDPRPSPLDPPALKIEVYSETLVENNSVQKCIYKGTLISWNTMDNENSYEYSVRLPLLLCRGTRGAIDNVHLALSKMFDCMLTPLPLTSDDLKWLLPIVIMPIQGEGKPKAMDEVKIEYTVPGLPTAGNIGITYNLQDLVNVLIALRRSKASDHYLSLRRVEKFHECLESQALILSSVQLALCTLHRISMPNITIMNNRMKISKVETMNRVLLYLNEKALKVCHSLSFTN